MYKKLLVGLSALIIVLLAPGFVTAQTNDDSTEVETTTQSEDVTTESAAEDKKTRVEEYKAKQTKRMTASEEKKVAGVCKTSQQRLEKVQTSVQETVVKREEKLKSVALRLDDLSVKLREASVNTSELDAVIVNLKAKTTEMLTEFEEYQQMLDDASTIDCATDPQGFKASVESARAKRAEIKTMSTDIKKYATESVKTTLDSVKTTLSQTTVESEE